MDDHSPHEAAATFSAMRGALAAGMNPGDWARSRAFTRAIDLRPGYDLFQQPDILCCRTFSLRSTLDNYARKQIQIVAFLILPTDFLVAD